MSSKLSFISAPTQLRSDTVSTLNEMSRMKAQKESDARKEANLERRFQIQNARQGRLDSLAQARHNLAEKRYNQDRADKLAAMQIGPSFIDTDSVTSTTESVDDPATAFKDFDVNTATDAADKAPKIFDYKAKTVDSVNEKILPEYDKIMGSKDISDDEKTIEIRKLMAANGMQDQLDEEDSGLTRMFKGFGRVMSRPAEYSAKIGSGVTGLFSADGERAMDAEAIKLNSELNDYYKIDSPVKDFRASIEKTRSKLAENVEGKAKVDASYDAQAKFFDQFKTETGYTGKKDVTTSKLTDKKDYNADVQKQATSLIKKINGSKDSEALKANRVKAVNMEVKRKLVEYASDQKLVADAAKETAKADRKLSDKIIAQRQSQKAKKDLKILELAYKRSNDKEKKQKMKLEMDLLRAKIATEKKK